MGRLRIVVEVETFGRTTEYERLALMSAASLKVGMALAEGVTEGREQLEGVETDAVVEWRHETE